MPYPPKSFCPVVGCKSEFNPRDVKGKKFFKFPLVEQKTKYLKLWIQFTRRSNFTPINERLCEDHFDGKCFKYSKTGVLLLKKDAVPTIWYDTDGRKITVTPRKNKRRYSHSDVEKYFSNTQEKQQNDWRREKIIEIKQLCRFCFTTNKNTKYYSIKKIKECRMNPQDLLKLVGVDSELYGEYFSKIICDDCLKKIVQFERYRVKCHRAQDRVIDKLQELNLRIDEVTGVLIEDLNTDIPADLLEPGYSKTNDSNCDNEDFPASPVNNLADSDYERHNELQSHSEIFIKTETFDPPQDEMKDEDFDDIPDEEPQDKPKSLRKEYLIRKHECLFCHRILANYKLYKTHDCAVKEIKCNVTGCGKAFKLRQTYNNHINSVHKKARIRDFYCPACQTHRKLSAKSFQEHCLKCASEGRDKYVDNAVTCQVKDCNEVCDNLELYLVHMMFHDDASLVKEMNEKGVVVAYRNPVPENYFICDYCSKEFKTSRGLREHRENVHWVGFKGEMYKCDLCPAEKINRRLIYKHMADKHVMCALPCKVCGKVFRSHDLRFKHMLHHDASKRKFFCELCPQHIGFIAKSDFHRHLSSVHKLQPPEKPHSCKLCNRTYATVTTLNFHRKKVHGIPLPDV